MTFNLIDEPWLPCVMPLGHPEQLSIRNVLVRAQDIRELRHESPLVTAALHRLLLALLHRVVGPADAEAWRALWEAGTLPVVLISKYLDKWHNHFDLLDSNRPFYQTAGFSTAEPSGVNRLAQELACGNNATLFDHTNDTNFPAITPAEAARLIVAEQTFAVGGGKSTTGYTAHAPLVGGATVIPQGNTLRETLLLNLVTYDGDEKPFPANEDCPFWERDRRSGSPLEKMSEHPAGYLDLLTWQSRTLRLHAEDDTGTTVIRRVSYAQGRRFSPRPGFREPTFAIKRDRIKGDKPIRLTEDKAIWRESGALMQFASNDEFRGPLALEELADRRLDVENLPHMYPTNVIGLCTDKAKVNFWRHERLPLPLKYLSDRVLVKDLKSALALAEQVAETLRSAVQTAARVALSPADATKADKTRVSQLVDSLAPQLLFWSRLEEPFGRLLADLPEATQRIDQLRRWFETLRKTAWDAYNQTAGELGSSARDHHAAVEGESTLNHLLARLRGSTDFRHIFPPLQPLPQEDAYATG